MWWSRVLRVIVLIPLRCGCGVFVRGDTAPPACVTCRRVAWVTRSDLGSRVVPEPAVQVPIAPLAGAELARPDDALELEAGLLQRPLLGAVLRVSAGLDALHRGVAEQVVAEHRLGAPADAAPAPLRQQRDSDLAVLGDA